MKVKAVGIAVLVAATWGTAWSYISETWPFDKLGVRSELIVIAHALSSVDAEAIPSGRLWKEAPAVTVVETTFEPELVLKGTVGGTTFKVRHHRVTHATDQDSLHMCCLPSDFYIEFKTKPRESHLMFLIRAKDGRYEPVTGAQEENKSVWRLPEYL